MEIPQSPIQRQAGLILREREPLNFEYPFDQLDGLLTPNDLFYIRSHFKAPQIDANTHLLRIGGAVRKPLTFSLAELLKMPSVTRTATLECAGNSRVFLSPQLDGAQWQLGAVSTAKWTGVPLPDLFDQAGLMEEACEIVFQGADRGMPKEKPQPPGEIHYARSIPRQKLEDVLIAHTMNGEPIGLDHGFPLRAIVPGHFGMASVKWLTDIIAVRDPFTGYWQTSDYAYWETLEGNPVRRPLGPMAVKSCIARPRMREVIPAGQTYRVTGAAWTGDGVIAQVEVSTDDGNTWKPGSFLDEARPFVWRRWEYLWQVPSTEGPLTLKARARDDAGNVQPAQHEKRFGSYVVNHTLGIEVLVR